MLWFTLQLTSIHPVNEPAPFKNVPIFKMEWWSSKKYNILAIWAWTILKLSHQLEGLSDTTIFQNWSHYGQSCKSVFSFS